jgi:hypothetical protein
MTCPNCLGCGWVCEDHPDRPSGLVRTDGCQCGGAGVPCACNPEARFDFAAVIASVDPDAVRNWAQ